MECLQHHPTIKVIVHGTPYNDYPSDFFIPPDYLDILLEEFEGPLDLLLYIIRKKNFDIAELPIAEITKQYLTYLELCMKTHRDLAIDYLCMASTLIALKARMILPRARHDESDLESGADPRAELVKKLQDYARCQAESAALDRFNRMGRDFFDCAEITCEEEKPILKQYPSLIDLKNTYLALILGMQQRSPHEIEAEQYSTEEAMQAILDSLSSNGLHFEDFLLYYKRSLQWGLSSFLGILELGKQHRIQILQQHAFESIYLVWSSL